MGRNFDGPFVTGQETLTGFDKSTLQPENVLKLPPAMKASPQGPQPSYQEPQETSFFLSAENVGELPPAMKAGPQGLQPSPQKPHDTSMFWRPAAPAQAATAQCPYHSIRRGPSAHLDDVEGRLDGVGETLPLQKQRHLPDELGLLPLAEVPRGLVPSVASSVGHLIWHASVPGGRRDCLSVPVNAGMHVGRGLYRQPIGRACPRPGGLTRQLILGA